MVYLFPVFIFRSSVSLPVESYVYKLVKEGSLSLYSLAYVSTTRPCASYAIESTRVRWLL